MKKCFKCNIEKPLSDYYKHKEMKDGHLNKCKECTKKDTNNNPRVLSTCIDGYDKTEKGVIRVIYKTQRRNSKIRKMDMPNYSKEELSNWLYENNFKTLYNNWEKSCFEKNLKPSVDRLDDFKPYTFDNIRLGTWLDNANHQREDILKGIGTGGRRCKPVVQYDSNNNIIAEYVSFSEARRVNGYSMEKGLKNGKVDRKGFIWKYK